MPVCFGANDAADWARFTSTFVRAAAAIGPERLDAAAALPHIEGIHAVFSLDGWELTDRPTKIGHLRCFLEPWGLDGGFWDRRIASKDELDIFMLGL